MVNSAFSGLKGFSGYNSRKLLNAIPRVFPIEDVPSVMLVVIMIGANDAALPGINKLNQAVSIEQYSDNLREIIDYFIQVGIPMSKILLITPPPIDVEAYDKTAIVWASSRF